MAKPKKEAEAKPVAPAVPKSKACCKSPSLTAVGMPKKRTGDFAIGKGKTQKKTLWHVDYECQACKTLTQVDQPERPEYMTVVELQAKAKAEAAAKAKVAKA